MPIPEIGKNLKRNLHLKSTMNTILLDDIAFKLDIAKMHDDLRITKRKRLIDEFRVFAEESEKIARPKAVIIKSEITEKGIDYVIINSEKFVSRVLRVNLEETDMVFLVLATCGVEIDEWSRNTDDILHSFWIDSIKEMALSHAVIEVNKYIQENYISEGISLMTPGSLKDWPIYEQKKFFNILGENSKVIGVRLNDSFIMQPLKTISAIAFYSKEGFQSCMLCSRKDCPNRRALFNEHLFEQKYQETDCSMNNAS